MRNPINWSATAAADNTPHPRTTRTSLLRQSLMKQRAQIELRQSRPPPKRVAKASATYTTRTAATARPQWPTSYNPSKQNMPIMHQVMYNAPAVYQQHMYNVPPMYQRCAKSSMAGGNGSSDDNRGQCSVKTDDILAEHAVLSDDEHEDEFSSASSVLPSTSESTPRSASNNTLSIYLKSEPTLPAIDLQLDEQVGRIRQQIHICRTQLNDLLQMQSKSMQPNFGAECLTPDSYA